MTSSEPARTPPRRLPTVAVAVGSRLRAALSSPAASLVYVFGGQRRGAFGVADGAVPRGTTPFDEIPAVANLDPALLDALRRAVTDAAADGVRFVVNSGWRSPEYQERLRRKAVIKYGSAEEAARWVATAEKSVHVLGYAVDLGPPESMAWMSAHGAGYGLCQIYENEPWHYELRPGAVENGCPPMYPDPSHDPRLWQ